MKDTTRTRILNAAYPLFYRHGYARVSVDMVAEAAGVTKRTLYNHFDSKDALVGAALEVRHQAVLRQMEGWKLDDAETPQELTALLFDRLGEWVGSRGWTGSGYTRITMELADLRGHPARKAASYHKAGIEALLAERYATLGTPRPKVLARHVQILMEGALNLALIHSDPAPVEDASAAAGILTAQHIRTGGEE